MSNYKEMPTKEIVEKYNELKKNLYDCRKELLDRSRVFENYFTEGQKVDNYLLKPECPTINDIKNYLSYIDHVNPCAYMEFTKGGYSILEDGLLSTFYLQELAIFMKHAYEYYTGKDYKIDTTCDVNGPMPVLNYRITQNDNSVNSKDLIIPQKAISLSREENPGFISVTSSPGSISITSAPLSYDGFTHARFMSREDIIKKIDDIDVDEKINKPMDIFTLSSNHDDTFVTDTLFRLIRYRVLNHHGAEFDEEDYDFLTSSIFGESYPIKEEVKDAFGEYSFERKMTK